MENKSSEKQALRILFLAAGPGDAASIRLGKELKEVQDKLAANPHFELRSNKATRPDDVLQAIMSYKPHIVLVMQKMAVSFVLKTRKGKPKPYLPMHWPLCSAS